jgi:glycosyltransferase involved in cell wall biosynthesis
VDDDSTDKLFKSNEEIKKVQEIIGFRIKYFHTTNKRSIGAKRNNLTKLATYKICANLDTDDIFLPQWLKHSMEVMKSDKRCSLVGTKGMLFCYPDDNFKLTGIECGEKRMIHESGMVYTKKHSRSMGGFKKSSQGEGCSMIDFNENKCLCTDASKMIICICHNDNTINKDRFRDKDIGDVELGGLLKKIVCDILNIPFLENKSMFQNSK